MNQQIAVMSDHPAQVADELTPRRIDQSTPPSPKWHVLWTRSQSEQMVYDQLSAKGFQLFLPRIDTWARRNGTRYRTSVPMFPGYVFVHHVMDKASYIAVRMTTGLVKLLGEQWDRLAIVSDREIEAIQKIHASRMPALPHPYLREGQRVRIQGGLLADVEGILLRTKPNKGLLVVSVDLLQRSVAVEVDCTLVAPA
jgi:transcription antitermination factor NusG